MGGLVTVAGAIVGAISGALPDIDVPSIGPFVQGYAFFDGFLPLNETLSVALLSVEILVVIAGTYAVMWALRKIPIFGPK